MNSLTLADLEQIDQLADSIAKHASARCVTLHHVFHTPEVLVALINSQTQLTTAYLGSQAAIAVVDRSAEFARSLNT